MGPHQDSCMERYSSTRLEKSVEARVETDTSSSLERNSSARVEEDIGT